MPPAAEGATSIAAGTPGRPRRRTIWLALARATVSAAIVLALYYTVPITGVFDADAAVRLVIGLTIYGAFVIWQIRAIISANYPTLRAVEAMGTLVPLLLVVFASAYLIMAAGNSGSFSEPIDKTGALYFTLTVFSTVGFGDIVPKTDAARVACMVQMVVDLTVIGVVVRLLFKAVQIGQQRKGMADPAEGK